jgi:7-cyano-7-deazaguanine synthase
VLLCGNLKVQRQHIMANKKGIVLLSGGLDSATTLYYATSKGYECFCLIFDYAQRHKKEIKSAIKIAKFSGCAYKVVKMDLSGEGSALLDRKIKLPVYYAARKKDTIPSTYVPARNIVFLSIALSYAEKLSASAIFIGANEIDYSGYPDCRPKFFEAFQKVSDLGTKSGAKGKKINIVTPLINLKKAEIIRLGRKLKVPYELTWSCYNGGKRPCGVCDSCFYRAKGFKEAGLVDPVRN